VPTIELSNENAKPPTVPTTGNKIPLPEMVDIPAGSFYMGSPEGGVLSSIGIGDDKDDVADIDEHPRYEVRIAHVFALSKYEITFA
jgi:formylglycine-generating enzyme required for sulfatase activity